MHFILTLLVISYIISSLTVLRGQKACNATVSSITSLNNFGRIFFAYLGTEEKLLVCKLQRSYSKDDLSLNLLSAVKENEKEFKKASRLL